MGGVATKVLAAVAAVAVVAAAACFRRLSVSAARVDDARD